MSNIITDLWPPKPRRSEECKKTTSEQRETKQMGPTLHLVSLHKDLSTRSYSITNAEEVEKNKNLKKKWKR